MSREEYAPGCFRNNVVELAGKDAIERAWEEYADQANQIADDPHLLADRHFNETLARKHEYWRRLFLRGGQ